ncbi:MAG: hypothetical protein VX265_14395 [Myxococcota bacterium]|nr:hypothetical protein [Myxococcota bacterium]MEC8425588.1 hypothetical protein [Myxococcota bacterium]
MSADVDVVTAHRHARWRWTGAPLLITGGLLLGGAVVALLRGGSGFDVMLGLFGCGLSLASFGANHEAAIAMALRARQAGAALPDRLAHDLDEELARDRSGTLGLRPSPRIALALPIAAALVQSGVAWRLFGA